MTGYQSKKAAAQDKLDSMEREALKLALKVLEDLPGFRADIDNAITAIKEALAQPAQEPVGTLNISRYKGHLENHDFDYFGELFDGTYSVYTAPPAAQPQRPWVGLTDEEIDVIYEQHHNQYGECESPNFGYERAIEAKLKERNA